MWNDWKWQMNNSYTNVHTLFKGDAKVSFNMKITPYYASLMDIDNINDPIRKQAVPDLKENFVPSDFEEKYNINIGDPLNESKFSPVKHLVHRYPDRVMLEATSNCFMYCRFCTRKRLTCIDNYKNDLSEAYDYIREHKEIRDVLISGGDPLTLKDADLEEIISKIHEIEHVEIIRIGTRAIVVNPMRITEQLVNMLKKYHPIWMNTHFNHPKEITKESEMACNKLVNAGIPLGNQSVLLKGINDDVDTYKELCLKLVKMRVRPYYLYQCDLGLGNEHFRTKVEKGIEIIRHLRQNITGFAIPTFVIDAPGGGGKIAINPENILEYNKTYVKLINSKNEIYFYPEIQGD